MAGVPSSPVKRWVVDDACRFCFEPYAFVWFRPELYAFHVGPLRIGHGPHCPVCGKCKCGMRRDWTEPPRCYTPI